MTTDQDTELGEFTHTRIYPAPRDLVFRCMTEPEHLTHFWGPTGSSTPIENIVVEPRAGGRFETRMVSDDTGDEYPMVAVFLEFDAPNRIVWAEPGDEPRMTNTVTFNDLGDGTTEVVMHQTNVPAMYLTPEAQSGLLSSFDKFEAYLRSL
jgi:uncharacterized protein YndB with AHSA1/START domain